LGGFELFIRTDFVRSHLTAPTLGSRHGQFEYQLARLERVVERDGPVNCIFLGSSMVWLGIEPETFSQAYKHKTGLDIRCFTFGVSALPTNAAGPVAEILIQDYQPELLIYGLSARDLAFPNQAEDAAVILGTPWVQYRSGHFTGQGWLYEHLYVFRYLPHFRKLLALDFGPLEDEFGTTSSEWYGFLPREEPITDKSLVSANDYAYEWLYNYKIWPETLLGLEQIVKQNGEDVQVIVLEMPVPPTHFDYYKNGRSDFDQYIAEIEPIIAAEGIPFWKTTDLQLIPKEGWWDPSHLNVEGAKVFSDWLGRRVGQAVIQGEIRAPSWEQPQ
jgi:hypothetical protein